MRFAFTEDQRLLAETVREVLSRACPPGAVRAAGTDPAARRGAAWHALAEIGLLGALIPEEHGGLGLTPLDTVLAYEETGRFAVPGPIVESAVAAPVLLSLDAAAEKWLPGIVRGAVAVSVRTADMPHLLDADIADLLVVQDGIGASITPRAEATLTERPSVDRTRRMFAGDLGKTDDRVRCRQVGPGPPDPEGGTGPFDRAIDRAFDRAFDRAALATAAQLIGLGRWLLDTAVGYAGWRRQFGTVIGSFQAIKHQLADVAIALEFAAPVVYRAAYAVTHEAPTAGRDVSAAKIAAGEAAHRAARTALQVHGAVGYTDELDLHLWLTRVWALRTAWGDQRWHQARLRGALLGGPTAVRLP